MERKALLTLTLGAILFLAHPAHAQFIGDRMRITAEHGEEILGRMKGYDAYSLTILTDSTELSIAYADMVRLQRSLGVRSYYRDGAMMGLGVGVFFSISAAATRGDALAAVVGIGFLGGVGGLTGMMVGATIRREKWKPLDIPDQNAASIIPVIGVSSTGRLALGDRMRITTEHGENLIGRMKSFDNSFLTILTDSAEQSIAYADMARLQRSLGIRSYYRDSAMMGLVVGGGGSIAVAAILGDPWAAIFGIGFFTPAISLGGMILGGTIRRERWERLDIPDQGPASIMPGIGVHPPGLRALENRMRITSQHGEEIIGQIKSLDNTSLTILTDSTEQSIAYADMARLQRSLGTRSRFLTGAVIGLGAGMLAGFRAASNIEQTTEAGVTEAFAALAVFLIGTGGGTLLGAIFGATIKREKWERLDIPNQGATSIMPIIGIHPTGRLALGARISF